MSPIEAGSAALDISQKSKRIRDFTGFGCCRIVFGVDRCHRAKASAAELPTPSYICAGLDFFFFCAWGRLLRKAQTQP